MTLAVDPAVAKPGLIAFAVVAALGVATFLLFRSMNNRIKKISFDERAPGAGGGETPGRRETPGGGETGDGEASGGEAGDDAAGEGTGTDGGYR